MSRCACGKPARLSGRGGLCAVCIRAAKYAREIESRIERAWKLARLAQRRAA